MYQSKQTHHYLIIHDEEAMTYFFGDSHLFL